MNVASRIAYPETRAALARRRRERALRPAAFAAVKRTFEEDWPHYVAVQVTAALCRDAGDRAERYALRGDDSVHLASFVEIAREAGPDTEFSSVDDRLTRAARLSAGARQRTRATTT
jgi:uncharacterized protein